MIITKVAIPPDTLIRTSFLKTDYEDAFLAEFALARPLTVEEVLKAFFLSAPAWVKFLFRMRNAL
ncbi:MAG TPA: hypothetical protein VEC36_10005, partial [Patescibacteria group bacterium]|nr:hypothetical protein [Patescibacteria group bacterium]